MAVVVINFPAKYLENTQTTQYTAPAATVAVIDKFTATNVSAASVTVSVNLVPFGGTPGGANNTVKTVAIPAGKCETFPQLVGQSVANGGYISAVCSAASAVSIAGTLREIT